MSRSKDLQQRVSPLRTVWQGEKTYTLGWLLTFASTGTEQKYQSEASQLRILSESATGVYLAFVLAGLCLITGAPWFPLALAALAAGLVCKSFGFVGVEVRDTALCLSFYLWMAQSLDREGGLALFLPRVALRKSYSDLLSAKPWFKFLSAGVIDIAVISLARDAEAYRFLPALAPYLAFLYLTEYHYRCLWKSTDAFRRAEVQAYDLFQTAELPQLIVDGQCRMLEVNAEAVSFSCAKGLKSPLQESLLDLFPDRYAEKLLEMVKAAIKGEAQQEELLLKDSEGEMLEMVRHKQITRGLATLVFVEPVKWAQRNCAKVLCLDVSPYVARRLLLVSEFQTLLRQAATLEKTIDGIFQSGEGFKLPALGQFNSLMFHLRNAMTLQRYFLGVIPVNESEFDIREDLTNLIEVSSVPATEKGLNVTLIIDTGLPPFVHGDRTKTAQVFKSVCDFAFEHASEGSEVTVMCRIDGATDENVKVNFRFTFSSMKLSGPDVKSLFLKPTTWKSLSQISKLINDYGTGLAVHGMLLDVLGGYMSDAYVQDSTACKILVSYIIPLRPIHASLRLTKVVYPSEHRIQVSSSTVQWKFRERRRKQVATYKRRTFDEIERSQVEEARRHSERSSQKTSAVRITLKKITELPQEHPSHLPAPETVLHTDFSENGLDENVQSSEDLIVSTLHRSVMRHATDLATIRPTDFRRSADHPIRLQRRRTLPSDQTSLPERYLLVEHNKYTKRVLVDALRKHLGTEPDFAANGMEALSMHKDAVSVGSRYSIVFVDVVMSEMDGCELARKLRAREKMMCLPHATVVGLLSALELHKTEEAQAAGMDAVCNSHAVNKADFEDELLRFLLTRQTQ